MNPNRSAHAAVWRLAWPNILSNLMGVLAFTSHLRIVSDLGVEAVAAVTSGHRVFFLLLAILIALSVATTALVARAWGAEDRKQAEEIATTSVVLGACISAILSALLCLNAGAVSRIFGLDALTTQHTETYIFWTGAFFVVNAVFMMLGTALRAVSDVIVPLWFVALATVLNIFLAWSLTWGEFGMPALGVAGAGIGAGLGATIATLAFLGAWASGWLKLGVRANNLFPRERIAALMRIGSPAALEQGVLQIGFLVVIIVIASYGTAAYSAYGIGISILANSIVVGLGFGAASAALVGQKLGAGEPEKAIAAGWSAMRQSILIMAGMSLVFAIFAKQLAGFFADDPETASLTQTLMYILCLVQPLMAIDFSIGGSLRGAGDTRYPLIVSVIALAGVRVSGALILAGLGAPLMYVYSVMIVEFAVKATFLIGQFRSGKWMTAIKSNEPSAVHAYEGVSRQPVRQHYADQQNSDTSR